MIILGSWGGKMSKEDACAIQPLSKNRAWLSFWSCNVLTLRQTEKKLQFMSRHVQISQLVYAVTVHNDITSANMLPVYLIYQSSCMLWWKIITSCCLFYWITFSAMLKKPNNSSLSGSHVYLKIIWLLNVLWFVRKAGRWCDPDFDLVGRDHFRVMWSRREAKQWYQQYVIRLIYHQKKNLCVHGNVSEVVEEKPKQQCQEVMLVFVPHL